MKTDSHEMGVVASFNYCTSAQGDGTGDEYARYNSDFTTTSGVIQGVGDGYANGYGTNTGDGWGNGYGNYHLASRGS